MSYTLISEFIAKPGLRDEMVKSIAILSQQPGFNSSKCYKDQSDDNKLVVVEQWDSQEKHEQFMKSLPESEMEKWLSLASEQPKQNVYTVAAQY